MFNLMPLSFLLYYLMMSKYRLFEIFTVAGRPVERQKKSEFCKDILGFFLDESFLVQR